MTDDGNMMDCALALYGLRKAIDDLGPLWFEPKDLQEIEQNLVRLHNLLRKHRRKQ